MRMLSVHDAQRVWRMMGLEWTPHTARRAAPFIGRPLDTVAPSLGVTPDELEHWIDLPAQDVTRWRAGEVVYPKWPLVAWLMPGGGWTIDQRRSPKYTQKEELAADAPLVVLAFVGGHYMLFENTRQLVVHVPERMAHHMLRMRE